MNINYIEGDLFAAIKDKQMPIVVPHICNNKGAFSAGFVVPLTKHYPLARERYLKKERLELGTVGFVTVGNVLICNMIAQELGGDRPLFYNHLARCLDKVAKRLHTVSAPYEVHAPAFGSGLSQGNWGFISELIEDSWVRSNKVRLPINIYYLPGTFLPPEDKK